MRELLASLDDQAVKWAGGRKLINVTSKTLSEALGHRPFFSSHGSQASFYLDPLSLGPAETSIYKADLLSQKASLRSH